MNTKQLRQKILDLAIRGKLVPQDPNDEPASVLLERVRAEKERLIKEGKIKRDKKDSAISRGDDKLHYGQLPQGWELAQIQDVCIVNPRNDVKDSVTVSFVPMALIDDGFSNCFTSQKRLWGEVKSGFTHFEEGDIGLAKITPCLENRKSVVFRGLTNYVGAGTTELHIFRPLCGSIIPEYLLWFFKTERFINGCIGAFSGAVGQQRVGKDHVATTFLPIPPVNEQIKIVEAIHSAFDIITEIENGKNSLAEAVITAKSKVLSLAVCGKLVPQDPNDEPASVLLDRIRAEREALIKAGKIKRNKNESTITRSDDNSYYENLPDGWITVPIDILFSVVGGGTPSTEKAEYWGEGIPWFSSADIDNNGNITTRRNVTQLGLDNSTTNVAPRGSVVVVTRVGLGKVAILNHDMCFSQDNQALIPRYSEAIDSRYLFNFMLNKMQTLKHYGRGTTILGITKKQLMDIRLWLPPIAEQRRIVDLVETAYNRLDSIVEILS